MMQRVLMVLAALVLAACASMTDLSTLAQWRAKADKAYQEGQYATALSYYQKLSKTAPSEAEIWFRLGNTHARMDQTDEAVKAYREAVLRDNRFSKAWYNAGFNQLRASAQTFSEATRYLSPDDPIYKIAKSYNEQLLQLMEHQNKVLAKAVDKEQNKTPVDVSKVEMIVLDGKPQKISDLPPALLPDQTTPESLEEVRLREAEQHEVAQREATPVPSEEPKKEKSKKKDIWHPPLLKMSDGQAE
jgi:tetratricopeptide (TPR) repeat protein